MAQHADIKVVRHRGGGCQHQSGDHSHDRGERHGGDDRQHEVAKHRARPAADELRQQRRGHVAAGINRHDVGRPHQLGGAETQEQRQQIKAADDYHRPDYRAARLQRGAYGEEAHQDMRQAGRAEHECDAEADLIDRRLEVQPRLQEALPQLCCRHGLGRITQQRGHARLHPWIGDHVLQESRQ